MKKKVIVGLLAVSMLFSFAGCSGSNEVKEVMSEVKQSQEKVGKYITEQEIFDMVYTENLEFFVSDREHKATWGWENDLIRMVQTQKREDYFSAGQVEYYIDYKIYESEEKALIAFNNSAYMREKDDGVYDYKDNHISYTDRGERFYEKGSNYLLYTYRAHDTNYGGYFVYYLFDNIVVSLTVNSKVDIPAGVEAFNKLTGFSLHAE